MSLTGNQRKELVEAILDAYPEQFDLEMMVSVELEENLNAIAGGKNLKQVVFSLIKWAEARGKIEVLIIAAYKTNPGNEQLQNFYRSIFQQKFVINPVPIETIADIGPAIDWKGPTNELELQSWFKPEPDFWDVGFLKRAIEQTSSVCRIEIPSQRIQATGVLIADKLVLTNYHVFKPDEEADIQTLAFNAILRFGCISSDLGSEIQGQLFKLDRQKPILHYSRTDKLDYILLQVENDIREAKDIKPARWDASNLPTKGMGINLLQHPEGNSMKISISQDGITGVYGESGLIQYVNKTSLGSSGSPCFDEDWKVVALHHAQRAKTFGNIREGILLSSIYQEIKSFL